MAGYDWPEGKSNNAVSCEKIGKANKKYEKILHINLKSKYFYEIKNGIKVFEYRLKNDYWTKRLVDKNYDEIHIKLGYPKADNFDKIIIVPYRGFEIQKIKHELFGDKEVEVYAIKLSDNLI